MGFALTSEPRIEPRVRALVRARMRDSHSERDVCIIDVSTRGMLATTAQPPERGEYIEVQLGRHRLTGHVKWASDRRFGMILRERVSVAAVVEGGTGQVALASSVGQTKRKQSLWAALKANTEVLGRATQAAIFMGLALVAGFVIFELVSQGMAPVEEASSAMHSEAMN